ncbi:MAG TPA: transcription antitermination factor NusB [Euzebyales bacterium]
MTSSRHADRQRAVALLYEADVRDDALGDVIARAEASDDPPEPFAASLVLGVAGRLHELDGLIEAYARGWTVARMPVVDRNLLRLGLWELIGTDTPVAVVIDEAVELANELSTPDSGRFVNGVLAQVARSEAGVAAARS